MKQTLVSRISGHRRTLQEFTMLRMSGLEQLSSVEFNDAGAEQHPTLEDERYQDGILPAVSRTFALTIPQLPPRLRRSVTTAYLLCRIADTIEDEPTLTSDEKRVLLERFASVVSARAPAAPLATRATAHLSEHTLQAERDLVLNLERIVRLTIALETPERMAIERCIHVMCTGMHHYQEHASLQGLERISDLDGYCYCVAGCVGEMLTDLFSAHCAQFPGTDPRIRSLAISFGQGLQMTNILKDIWEDRLRGTCWLPRDVFGRHRLAVEDLPRNHLSTAYAKAMTELIGIGHAHLRDGLAFTLAIPNNEIGIRKFCFLALGMAVLTLQKIQRNPWFTLGEEVKITRTAVFTTKVLTDVAAQSDRMLRAIFDGAARGLVISGR